MGIVWEAYHKGVPLLGVPENPTDQIFVISKGWEGSQDVLTGKNRVMRLCCFETMRKTNM